MAAVVAPTPEELAELSRLHNDLRHLRFLFARRKDSLFKPINEAAIQIRRQLRIEFELPIEQIKREIHKIRLKTRISSTSKSLRWRYDESWTENIK